MALSRALIIAAACVLPLTGCQEKETVVDVQTPAGDIEVTKDKADGDIAVTVDKADGAVEVTVDKEPAATPE